MLNLLLLVICILSGYILRSTAIVKKEASIPLNQIIIYFFIPVITLKHLPEIDFQSSYIWLLLCPWLIYLGSFLFFRSLQLILSIQKETTAVLIMTGGISSTSFVGFPIFEILYGQEGLILGIIMSIAGTVVVFNTAGVFTGFWYAENQSGLKQVFLRMLKFPPFIAFLLAVSLNLLGYTHPAQIKELLDLLSKPFTVLVLLTIGIQLEVRMDKDNLHAMLLGQLYKLVIAPVLVATLMYAVFGELGLVAKVCILGAAIGSMNAVSIMAAQLGLNPKLAVQMPSLGIPLSVGWLLVIDWLFF